MERDIILKKYNRIKDLSEIAYLETPYYYDNIMDEVDIIVNSNDNFRVMLDKLKVIKKELQGAINEARACRDCESRDFLAKF